MGAQSEQVLDTSDLNSAESVTHEASDGYPTGHSSDIPHQGKDGGAGLSRQGPTPESGKVMSHEERVQPESEITFHPSSSAPQSEGQDISPELSRDEMVRAWVAAIDRKDCKILMQLLKKNAPKYRLIPRDDVVTKLGIKFRSALHVAAMQGCFPLTKLILDHLEIGADLRRYIDLVDGASALTALQMADDIVGDHSIAQYILRTRRYLATSRSEDVYLFEAYPGSTSHELLIESVSNGHCKHLSRYLKENPRLLHETLHGIPILHMAVCLDDFDMVHTVLKLFGTEKHIQWHGVTCYPSNFPLQEMLNPSRWDIRNVPDDILTENKKRALMECGGSVSKLVKFLGHDKNWEDTWTRVEMEDNDSPDESRNLASATLGRTDPANSRMRTKIVKLLDQVHWKEAWNVGFNDDVDYNFADTKMWPLSLLRFFHACKDPPKFQDFFENIVRMLPGGSNLHAILSTWGNLHAILSAMEEIFELYDPQGRSLLHILLDHFIGSKLKNASTFESLSFSDPDLWRLGKFLSNKHHRSGGYLLEIVLTKSYLHNNFPISFNGGLKMDYIFQQLLFDCEDEKNSMVFILALILGQTKVAQYILNTSESNQTHFSEILKFIIPNHSMPPLLIAASFANQTILRLLLKMQFDPMITDKVGRSALHHAANASIFSHIPNITRSLSTVEDLCKFREKWVQEREGEVQGVQWHSLSTTDDLVKSEDGSTKKVNRENYDSIAKLVARMNVERKACILMLLQAGVDLSQPDKYGRVPDVGPTSDVTHQSWWYELVVKDSTDKKNSFNQAGNALSVVGALVAATSYIGPLQPPLSYDEDTGFVHSTQSLVQVFMVSNTLAFYLAMAAVMFAVVPSLPMPQEGVMSELRRARHMVSFSLCLLLMASGFIMLSFAAASLVVIQYEHSFHRFDLLFWPSLIGWFFCLIAIVSFLIRVLKLIFYDNSIVRQVYQFSFSESCKNAFSKICEVVQKSLVKLKSRDCRKYGMKGYGG